MSNSIHLISDQTKLDFMSWRGVIQPVKPVIEVFNRLGSSEVTIQELRKESQVTQATAVINFANQADMVTFVHSLAAIVGKKSSLLDDNTGLLFDPIYVIDFSYRFQKVDGTPVSAQSPTGGGSVTVGATGAPSPESLLATFSISIISDTWSD